MICLIDRRLYVLGYFASPLSISVNIPSAVLPWIKWDGTCHPAVACPNGLPPVLLDGGTSHFAPGDWVEGLSTEVGLTMAAKGRWYCERRQTNDGFMYMCSRDGVLFYGDSALGQCSAGTSPFWSDVPPVPVAPNVPDTVKDCVGNVRLVWNVCGVTYWGGAGPSVPTLENVTCNKDGTWYRYSYRVSPPWARVDYGAGNVKNREYDAGVCTGAPSVVSSEGSEISSGEADVSSGKAGLSGGQIAGIVVPVVLFVVVAVVVGIVLFKYRSGHQDAAV
jgi:hypothetical protein